MSEKTMLQTVVAVGGSLLTYLFGGWSALLSVLVSFVVVDYITGVLAAALEGKLNSETGIKGIVKKILIFTFVAIGNLLDIAIGSGGSICKNAVIYFFLSNELLSIVENAGRIGLPIPEVLRKAVEILNEKATKE